MTRIDVGSDPVIRVLLVDDHVAYRQAFAVALENETDFEVIGQASDYSGARSWLGDVDIILIGPSQSDGANRLVRELHSSNPNGKAVIFVSGTDRREVALAIEAGAFGVLPISTDFTEVAVALRRVCEGDSLMAPQETIDLLRMAADYRARRS